MHRILLLASLLLFPAAVASAAELLNGSFEPLASAPADVAPVTDTTIPGWSATGGGIAWCLASAAGFAAPNGERAVAFVRDADTADCLSQAIATVPGATYDVTFWLGSRAGERGHGRASVRVDVAGTMRTATIDNPARELLWQPHVVSFTATGTMTTVAFRGVRHHGAVAAWLDGVAVRPAASAAR